MMADKMEATALHSDDQDFIAAEAEPEGATTAEGEKNFVDNKERARASRAAKVQAHG